MAEKADGQILVDTKIDSEGFERGSAELLKAIQSLTQKMQDFSGMMNETMSGSPKLFESTNQSAKTVGQRISGVEKELNSLDKEIAQMGKLAEKALTVDIDAMEEFQEKAEKNRQKIKDLLGTLGQMKDAKIPTDHYKQITELIQKADSTLAKLVERQYKMDDLGVKKNSKAYKSLRCEIEQTEDELANLKIVKETLEKKGAYAQAFDSKQLEAYAERLESIKSESENIVNKVLNANFPTKNYTRLTSEIEKTSSAVDKLVERQNKMKALGAKEDSREYKSLQYDIEQAIQKLEQLQVEENELRENGNAYELGFDTDAVNQNTESLKNAIQRLKELQGELDQTTETNNSSWSQMRTLSGLVKGSFTKAFGGIKSAADTALYGVKHPIQGTDRLLGTIVTKAGQAASAIRGIAKNTVTAGLQKVTQYAKQAAASFLHLGRSTKTADKGMLGNFATMIKYGLGLRSLYTLVNKAKAAIASGFQNLAQYSDQTNGSISSMQSALTRLQNSLATAFAPIITVVAPALTKLINMLSQAVTYIGMFIAALTGAKTFTKATAVQQDYAASLRNTAGATDKVGKSAKEAGQAAKEASRQLAAFDELNILSNDSSDNGSGSDGSGSGNTPDTGLDDGILNMFEEVPIEAKISDFVKRIKDAFAAGDYAEIGRIIGEKINDVFRKLHHYIHWDTVGGTITKYVNAFCEIFNSLVDTIDWDLIGSTFAAGINTLVMTAYLLLTGINWQNIGIAIATGLNAAIRDVDWNMLGMTIGSYFQAKLDVLNGAVTNFDWHQLGLAFATGINGFTRSIDWGEAGQTLSAGIIGALETLRTAVANVDWYQLGQDVKDFLCGIDWTGMAVELFAVLGVALGGLGSFLVGVIGDGWQAVVDWWHEKAYEDGNFTIQGLLQGILDALCDIAVWIRENILKPFIEGFCDAFDIHSPSRVMAELGDFIIQGLLQGISNAWKNVTSFIGKACKDIKETVSGGFNKAKTAAATAALDLYSEVSGKFASTVSTVRTKVSTFKSNVKTGFEEARQNIINKMSDALSTVDKQDWVSVGSNICSGISNGLNSGWNWLTSKVSNLANSLLESAKSELDIHSPSRRFRDEVGLMLGLGVAEGMEKSQTAIIRSVAAVADRAANEFKQTDMYLTAGTDNLDTALSSFADRVSDSFVNLVSRLEAIADKVAYTVPSMATGSIMPYEVTARGSRSSDVSDAIEASNDELCSVFIQALANATMTLVNAIESKDTTIINNVDQRSIAQGTVNEINRMTRMMGRSPLLIPKEV